MKSPMSRLRSPVSLPACVSLFETFAVIGAQELSKPLVLETLIEKVLRFFENLRRELRPRLERLGAGRAQDSGGGENLQQLSAMDFGHG